MDLFRIERYNEDSNVIPAVDQLAALKAKIGQKRQLLETRDRKINGDHLKSNDIVDINNDVENASVSDESNVKKQNKKKYKQLKSDDDRISEDKKEIQEELNENQVTEEKSKLKKKKKLKRKNVSDDERKEKSAICLEELNIKENSESENLEYLEKLDINDNKTNENENKDQNEKKDIIYFPILNKQKHIKKISVKTPLPKWLTEKQIIPSDITNNKQNIQNIDFLQENTKNNLLKNSITNLFPVQATVVPYILNNHKRIVATKFPPHDICVQAPTGSGKTLAYVLPIIELLSQKSIRELYCLVVLPSKDLALQVKNVFDSYTQGTDLKVALLSGVATFPKEQQRLVEKIFNGDLLSKIHVAVCTPGRLVDHIKTTKGFSLKYLQYLVIDEADKLLSQEYSGWLDLVMQSVYKKGQRKPYFPLTVATFECNQQPLQKMLFSATLTQNPEKLTQLKLFNPKLFVTQSTHQNEVSQTAEGETKEVTPSNLDETLTERFVLPEKLKQKLVIVEPDEKPLVLLYFLLTLKYTRVLCFTKSIENTHRLYFLYKLYGGFTVSEFSSSLTETQRKGIIRDFKDGKIDLLVCSDAMARGMHIDNVSLVVNYDTPVNGKTYVHRVGRTARAGTEGEAVTILSSKEMYHFKLMCKELGTKVPKMKISSDMWESYNENYEQVLSKLQAKIIEEKRDKSLQKRK